MARLDEICSLNMGQSPDSSSYNETGDGIPFFQGNADFGESNPTVRVWCNAPTKIAHSGDILISVRAPIGALNVATGDCCIGRGLAALTVNQDLCNRGYIWYALVNKVDELNSKGTGSTFKAISKSILAETEIPLPSLEKQHYIACILGKVSDLIRLRKQQIAKLDELVKARFVEMFGDFIHEKERWPVCQIGDVAESIDPQPSHRTPPVVPDGVPYVGIAECDYLTHTIDFEHARKVGKNVLAEHIQRYSIAPGDFIIGKIGTIGKPFFIPTHQNYTLSANTVLIKPIKSKISSYFLFSLFQSAYMDRIIDQEKKSTSQPAFGIQKVRSIFIPLPPLEIQKQFEDFTKQNSELKLTIQQSLDKLEILKKSLMQEYFG